MKEISVAIHGAAGRMGRRLVALGDADPGIRIASALDRADHPELGHDVGRLSGAGEMGIPLACKLTTPVDVVIDFSTPEASVAVAEHCRAAGIALVAATTGLSDQQKHVLGEAATQIPIVWAPSMSLAVNLTMDLAARAAEVLRGIDTGVDVEIIERHHRFKEDAPSGTALRFGEIIAGRMGQSLHRHGREGRTGQRPPHEIGYHALRVGDNPGEHTIVFGMLGESIELTVKATNRDSYALGALAAAKFVVGKPPALYSMMDVLGM